MLINIRLFKNSKEKWVGQYWVGERWQNDCIDNLKAGRIGQTKRQQTI